jgi:hypothetical protein
MIAWLSLVGAVAVTTGAALRLWLRPPPRPTRDTDWGDWPPDQMAP